MSCSNHGHASQPCHPANPPQEALLRRQAGRPPCWQPARTIAMAPPRVSSRKCLHTCQPLGPAACRADRPPPPARQPASQGAARRRLLHNGMASAGSSMECRTPFTCSAPIAPTSRGMVDMPAADGGCQPDHPALPETVGLKRENDCDQVRAAAGTPIASKRRWRWRPSATQQRPKPGLAPVPGPPEWRWIARHRPARAAGRARACSQRPAEAPQIAWRASPPHPGRSTVVFGDASRAAAHRRSVSVQKRANKARNGRIASRRGPLTPAERGSP